MTAHKDATEAAAHMELLAFLAHASTELASSLNYEETLDRVVHLAVPRLGDWCAVDMRAADGTIHMVAVAHKEPEKEAWARELRRRRPPDPSDPHGVPAVLRTGVTEIYPVITDDMNVASSRDAEELRLRREIGSRSCIIAPLRVREQTLGTLMLLPTDPQRRYGEADRVLAEELARRAAVAVENARLYRESQQAVQVRDDFLSTAVHELQTPLTALKLQIQGLIRTAARAPTPERINEAARKVDEYAERLSRLVDTLLDGARLSTGRLALDLAPTDLGVLAQEVCARFEPELQRSGVVLRLSGSAAGVLVAQWDGMRLDQVLTNLIGNAIKYGEGRPIDVVLSQEEGWAVVSVRDQGIGIAPEDQGRVFERFERAVSSRGFGGFGLGLWIVRQIIDALGGTVELHSQPGVGSTFVVRLPLTAGR